MLVNHFRILNMADDGGDPGNTGGSSTILGGSSSTGNPDSGKPEGSPNLPEWAGSLPDEYKSSPTVLNHKDLPSFVKTALEAEKLIGKKGIIKPGEGASQDELNKFYNDLGRPEKPEGYDLKKPENWSNDIPFNEKLIPKVQEMFHKRGISLETGKALFDDYNALMASEYTGYMDTSEASVKQGLEDLKKEWGGEEKYNANIEIAKKAVNTYGDKSLIEFLEKTGLGNHPSIIKAFAKAGENLKEDTIIENGKSNNNSFMNEESAKQEIVRLRNDPEFSKYYYSGKLEDREKHKECVEKMEYLHKIAYPTLSR